ncbi:MAG: hypothetical protein J6A89_01580 [Clostridia bacterium]|nr:hypothetical protein [Clostridia bacterium]
METIPIEVAKEHGINTKHSTMDNGEIRYRLISSSDNSSYVRAEATEYGGWQNSHFHKFSNEIYVVQSGKIIIVELLEKNIKITKLKENEMYKLKPNIYHNVYMYPNAVTHTIKYGKSIPSLDWFKCEMLDDLIMSLNIPRMHYNKGCNEIYSAANIERLEKAINDAKEGKLTVHELVEYEDE